MFLPLIWILAIRTISSRQPAAGFTNREMPVRDGPRSRAFRRSRGGPAILCSTQRYPEPFMQPLHTVAGLVPAVAREGLLRRSEISRSIRARFILTSRTVFLSGQIIM